MCFPTWITAMWEQLFRSRMWSGRDGLCEKPSVVAQMILEKLEGSLGKGRFPWKGCTPRKKPNRGASALESVMIWAASGKFLPYSDFPRGLWLLELPERVKSYRDSHRVCDTWRCACEDWFSLEVGSDSADLKINSGNHASGPKRPIIVSLPCMTTMAKMRILWYF